MADIDVKAIDNDGTNQNPDPENDNLTSTDLGFFSPSEMLNGINFYLKHLNKYESSVSGTGNFSPILRVNGDTTLRGFNTAQDIDNTTQTANNLDIDNSWTNSIQLKDIPIVYFDFDGDGNLEAYREFRLDINEDKDIDVSLEEFQLFTSASPATLANYQFTGANLAFGAGFDLVFDLDATGDNKLLLSDEGAGQGRDDYIFYIPLEDFGDASPLSYVTIFSQFGPTPPDDAGFAEWRVQTASQIDGIKFKDLNNDGIRDANGIDNIAGNTDDEVGLAGFVMYIDANNNNVLDTNEQYVESGAGGLFSFYSLLADTDYVIREVLTEADLSDDIKNDPGYVAADWLPPAGLWDLTTGSPSGDHLVEITDPDTYTVEVGNRLLVPSLNVTKTVTSITGGVGTNGLTGADSDDDVINYAITLVNTGDVALHNISVTDPNADTLVRGVDIVGNNDNVLDVGETWSYTATHNVTQAELDGKGIDAAGVIDGDGDDDNTVTADSDETGPDTASAFAPLVYDPELDVTKVVTSITGGVGVDGLDGADSDDDVINYAITLANTGNISLHNISVTDPNADTLVRGVDIVGNNDNVLDVGETWSYTATHNVTQAELDGKGIDAAGVIDGDGDDDNTVTADSDETGPDTASAFAPLVYDPELDVTKVVTSITGGVGVDGLDGADSDDDVINYAITLANTGNISLHNISVTDPNADTLVRGVDIVGNNDNVLDVGETWSYTATHNVTQDELDGKGIDDAGVIDGDGDDDNTVTADSDETGPDTASAFAPLVYDPDVDLTKFVSVAGSLTAPPADDLSWDDANGPLGPENVNLGDDVWFKVTIENTGNVTLTDVDVDDTNLTGGAPGTTFRLMEDGVLTTDAVTLYGATLDGDDDNDHFLDVDETWTIIYKQAFDPDEHLNTADVSSAEGASDEDSALYFSLINEGPGVRTPGFWQNPRNGGEFWDGVAGNEKEGPCFPEGDLLLQYGVTIDGVVGLLLGDWNKDGVTDADGADNIVGTADDEDTLFISYDAAKILINASQKDVQDGRYMLGRDVVATWLNYLAGNEIGEIDGDANDDPKEAIQDAINFLQTYGDSANNGILVNGGGKISWDGGAAIKTSSTIWQTEGADVHGDLDEYNNTGWIDGVQYAHDCDDSAFVTALTIYKAAHDLF